MGGGGSGARTLGLTGCTGVPSCQTGDLRGALAAGNDVRTDVGGGDCQTVAADRPAGRGPGDVHRVGRGVRADVVGPAGLDPDFRAALVARGRHHGHPNAPHACRVRELVRRRHPAASAPRCQGSRQAEGERRNPYAANEVSEVAHWDGGGGCGNRTVSRPEANSTPDRAMDLLLEKARLVFGDQDWSSWEWKAQEYGTREPRVISFFWRDGAWTRPRP